MGLKATFKIITVQLELFYKYKRKNNNYTKGLLLLNMRFIHLLSLFAACHAAQTERVQEGSLDIEANKDGLLEYATIAGDRSDDGASSTHGRMLARRTSKRTLAIKHVHKWMNDFNPVNLEPSALVYAVKHDDLLGSEIKIVQWWFKLATISTAVSICGVLVGGITTVILAYAGVTGAVYDLFYWFFYSTAPTLFGVLSIADVYALWAVPDQRIPYLVMLIVIWVVNGSYLGLNQITSLTTWMVSCILYLLMYGLVAWYNWYKVLFPTWTGWAAKHWPQ